MDSRGQTVLVLMGHPEDPPPSCALFVGVRGEKVFCKETFQKSICSYRDLQRKGAKQKEASVLFQ